MPAAIGSIFCNAEGNDEFRDLRVDHAPEVTGERAPIRMLGRVPSEECGCPEELWSYEGLILLFHFEEDGSSDAFLFAGDWEMGAHFEARTLDHLRAAAFSWVADVLNVEDPDCRDIAYG